MAFLSTPSARRATDSGSACRRPVLQFLSTPSARRATPRHQHRRPAGLISIHALREEGDAYRFGSVSAQSISIHALREEGDRLTKAGIAARVKFLSTPSARRATPSVPHFGIEWYNFYPRPPRGGRPTSTLWSSSCSRYFYPRPPRGGRRCRFIQTSAFFSISIHALREEGDRWPRLPTTASGYFYPRPPRGGRPRIRLFHCRPCSISIHALREEGDGKNREKTLCFCLIIHLSAQIAKRCL